MAILDNRTLLTNSDAVTNWEGLGGAGAGTADAETFIEGTASIAGSQTSTSATFGLLYNNTATLTLTGRVVYIWFNFAAAGLLQTQAAAGIAVRFTGATVTNWAERNIGGSDTYQGGWIQFVIDVDEALLNADTTNGTAPTANQIQRIGITVAGVTSMPKMQDNFWIDAMWYVDSAVPAILVEGTNAGPDWTWADIVSTAEAGSWGTAKAGPGGSVVVNGGIRFGANDAVTHGFSDTNQVILWEQAVHGVPVGYYTLQVIGGSGIQSFSMGLKDGTGDAATGGQGWVIAADAVGDRWDFDCNDANIDVCNLYGGTFIHGNDFFLDEALTSSISCQFIDCTSAVVSNAGDFLRNRIIDANTVAGAAFVTTDDVGDIVFCSFNFSAGHAIEILAAGPVTQTLKGNIFSGYGADGTTDAALYNNSAAARTINVTEGVASPTVRNGTSASTTVVNSVTLTLTGIKTDSEVRIINLDDVTNFNKELTGSEQISGSVTKIIIADGGTGYAVNDVLTVVGGTGTAATITVDAVSTGVVTAVSITTGGTYTANPANPVTTTVAPAGGTGCTLRLTIGGTFAYAYDSSFNPNVAIIIFHLDFKEVRLEQTLSAASQSIPIQQTTDRVYNNPA